jgi:hypothetical protein
MSGLDPTQSEYSPAPLKARGDGGRWIGDLWQWLGMSGDAVGTSGTLRRTFFYCWAMSAVLIAAVNTVNIITIQHEEPSYGLAAPIVWEGSSWITLVLFFWIPWIGYRLAPPFVRPRWKLFIHGPVALAFSLAHVIGFVGLRKLVYWLAGDHYDFGSFFPHFLYEFRKDVLDYALDIAAFTLIEHLLRQQQLIATPGQTLTFDIRDGSKLIRVQLAEVLAVSSAGNYVEFVMHDGRRPMMRSPLAALEDDLGSRGFVRTHRSWLVNAARMTALTPEGSGDYTVELGKVEAPLSRRFPDALAKLRGE